MEDMNPSRIFIKNVRYLARIRGLQIGEVEEHLGKARGHLANIYSSGRSLKLHECVELAQYLQAPLQDMVYQDLKKVTTDHGINLKWEQGRWTR